MRLDCGIIELLFKNNGDTPNKWAEQVIASNFKGAKCARVEDIDNDGLLHVVGAAFYDDTIAWLKNYTGMPIQWERNLVFNGLNGEYTG
jgi:hypothetical protein